MSQAEKHGKLRLILRFLKGSKKYFAVSIGMTALGALCDMLIPQIIRVAIDNAIGGAEPDLPEQVMKLIGRVGGLEALRQKLWLLALAVLAVAAVNVTAKYLFRVYNTKGAESLVKSMRDTLFGHISRLPYAWHMTHQTGDIIQRCTSDIETTRNFVSEQMTNILRIVVLLVMSVAFMLSMNGWLTLIAMLPIPVVIWYSVYFHRKLSSGFQACDEEEGRVSALVQ